MRKIFAIAVLALFTSALIACAAPQELDDIQVDASVHFFAVYTDVLSGQINGMTQNDVLLREAEWAAANPDFDPERLYGEHWRMDEEYVQIMDIRVGDEEITVSILLTTPSTALSMVVHRVYEDGRIVLRPWHVN